MAVFVSFPGGIFSRKVVVDCFDDDGTTTLNGEAGVWAGGSAEVVVSTFLKLPGWCMMCMSA